MLQLDYGLTHRIRESDAVGLLHEARWEDVEARTPFHVRGADHEAVSKSHEPPRLLVGPQYRAECLGHVPRRRVRVHAIIPLVPEVVQSYVVVARVLDNNLVVLVYSEVAR